MKAGGKQALLILLLVAAVGAADANAASDEFALVQRAMNPS